jgi:hypothetical protein
VPPLGDWEFGEVCAGGGVALPGFPEFGLLFGCGEGLLLLGLVVPEFGAAVPGCGDAVPGVGAAVPGFGAAAPGFGLAVPGDDWPGVAF